MSESTHSEATRINPHWFQQKHEKHAVTAGDSTALLLAEAIDTCDTPLVVVTHSQHESARLHHLLTQLIPQHQESLQLLPGWETLPYDRFSPNKELTSDRLETLSHLSRMEKGCVCVSINALSYRLPPPQWLHDRCFTYKVGMTRDITKLVSELTLKGYRRVSTVYEAGEYAQRGELLDLYPMGSEQPIRLDFFDNEIESIRLIDPSTQRSISNIEHFSLLPADEYPLDPDGIASFRKAWRERFSGNPMDAPVYRNISDAQSAPGAEYYLPLFHEKLSTFFDYLPAESKLIILPDALSGFDHYATIIQKRYEQLRYDQHHPLCSPDTISIGAREFHDCINQFAHIKLKHTQGNTNPPFNPLPALSVNHRLAQPLEKCAQLVKENPQYQVVICGESHGRQAILEELLIESKLHASATASWVESHTSNKKLITTTAAFAQGFIDHRHKRIIISEQDLLGQSSLPTSERKHKENHVDPQAIIRNLVELSTGDPVVHRQHGIGRYHGLRSLETDGITQEYLILHYASDDKLYVPVTSLHMITRYMGAEADRAPISRLGSASWEQEKEKAKKQIKDIAAELLIIHSKRKKTTGFQHTAPGADYLHFKHLFPFTETKDQDKAIEAIIQDMQSEQPMDRLVCGDVGFGKTEVAMRSAFIAVHSGKQVAVLAPTTLLANQHLQSFQERFADFPIRIGLCTRAVTGKSLSELKQALASGQLDIVVGTHKLLNPDLNFHNLGLLIVDEEHRFGVSHKEKIKALRHNIDILTMTATPIPRTLNLSLCELRDLSIIATPPSARLAIKTFVRPYRTELIQEAIERETTRGGQVYFLHNDIATMPQIEEAIKRLFPSLKTVIAHGQMPGTQLERIMDDFYHQKYHILIATTIIESGIDVPNANTILINQADQFGLAQLHQIRGRVGRSHHQAYAYLLTDAHKKLKPDAQKRLEALSQLTELGSGFALALQDLEIRGAGEILGDNQSGHIQKIGFSLYLDLLNEAVHSLKSMDADEHAPNTHETEINLGLSTLFTDDYVEDVSERLTLYKRLSSRKTREGVDELKSEIIDRFGPTNPEADQLFDLRKVTLIATHLGIKVIKAGPRMGSMTFNENPNIDHAALIQLIQTQSKRFQLIKGNQLRFQLNPDKKLAQVNEILNTLTPRE